MKTALPPAFVAALLLAAVKLPAQVDTLPDDDLRIRGIFNSSLPGTEQKHGLRLLFHPHLGDLSRRDFLRIPLGLRYGLTQNWEVTGEAETYISHGLGDVPLGEKFGFSQVHLGTKYHIGGRLFDGWDVAVGADFTSPVGSPPREITDGLEHVAPFFTAARRWRDSPDIRVFWGMGADLVDRSSIPGKLSKNQLGDDSISLTGGTVWRRGPLNYTLEATYATTRSFGGHPEDVFTLRPAVLWEVPVGYTARFGGRWVVGLGLRATNGPDGTDFGASGKVRVNFDFKRWWRGRTKK